LAHQRYVARARPPHVVSVLREDDALTRIRVGSHFDIPRLLAPFGEGACRSYSWQKRARTGLLHWPRGSKNGVSASSVSDLCRPDTSRAHAALPGATSLGAGNAPRLQRDDGDYSPVETPFRAALHPGSEAAVAAAIDAHRFTASLPPLRNRWFADSLLEGGVWSEPVSESGRGITAQFQNVYGSYWKRKSAISGTGSAGILILSLSRLLRRYPVSY
jgi:hypothetical protein